MQWIQGENISFSPHSGCLWAEQQQGGAEMAWCLNPASGRCALGFCQPGVLAQVLCSLCFCWLWS